jgi:acyl-CoA dehydrogenase
MDWIAESRIDLEMVRLLTLKTAWMMDNIGTPLPRSAIQGRCT